MIDLHDLKGRPEMYQEACNNKGISFSIQSFLELDGRYRTLLSEFESERAEQNRVSKQVQSLSGAERESALQSVKALATSVKERAAALKEVEAEWSAAQLKIPSIPLPETPIGKDDSDNVELYRWGTMPEPNDHADHVAIGERLKLWEFERGVKVAGARSYYLRGDGARLQHAVLNFAMDLAQERGYLLMDVPHIVRRESMETTGYFPGGEDMAFALDERDKDSFLIGTAEVPLCAYHIGDTVDANQLPLRYVGYSPCYRREAGAYGKDTRGLYRVHQFYKVEQVVFCAADADESHRMHHELLGNAETLLQRLELPYRVVAVSTGDMGQGQVYKHDIEAWMPSRNNFGETHSCSSFYGFQARRLGVKYKNEKGERNFCYSLNNTLVASPRILIAIVENYVQADGRVRIPEVLRPYMRGAEYLGQSA